MSLWKHFITEIAEFFYNYRKAGVSNLKSDETLVWFPTSAWFDQQTQQWHIPLHGWVYEPEDSTVRKAAIAQLIDTAYGIEVDAATEKNFTARINLLIADNERGKYIVIEMGERRYTLPRSHSNGHFLASLSLTQADVDRLQRDNKIEFRTILRDGDTRSYPGQVTLVPSQGISVISDIDDTIKVTGVTDKEALFRHTFYLDFAAVPGMAGLYTNWVQQHSVSLHYVSSSPWQLYPLLKTFVDDAGFPAATFSLKSIRFRDRSILNLFKKGIETKPAQIEPILRRYPQRQFILVGDSGEHDPEVYAGIYAKYPQQILKIFIRNIGNEQADSARMQQAFAQVPAHQWQLFDDPTQVTVPLT